MRAIAKAFMAGALVLAPIPVVAQNAGLDCMKSSYTAAQLSEFRRLAPGMSFAEGEEQAAANRMADIGMEAVVACASSLNWSEDQMMQAAFYEISRLSEAGYRQSGALTAAELTRFDNALAQGNRDRLWQVVERSAVSGMQGTQDEISTMDEILLGSFALSAGFGDSEEEGAKVGMLLGFMAMQRVATREFAALQRGANRGK